MRKETVGFAMCGSYCTYEKTFEGLYDLMTVFPDVIPILSENSAKTDSRFGTAEEHRVLLEEMTGKTPISTIVEAEPFGPKKLLDVLVVAPCTGNTLAKLASGVADTPVTLAVKAHLRNGRPVVIAVSTNDGLAAAGKNIMELMNRKNYYFVPFGQDDPEGKPTSLVADMGKLKDTVLMALEGRQIQPVLVER